MTEKGLIICAILVSCAAVLVSSISFEEDVTLTVTEKEALDKFKSLVIPKIPKSSYLQNYATDDLYFIHWLRAKRLNIQSAEAAFLNHIKWRESVNIDNINDDRFDWAQFNKEYPVFFNDTIDREGRPVGEFWFGDWNIRQGALAGLSRQMVLHVGRLFDMLNRRLYKARAEGKKVSQTSVIVDIEGFNLLMHACPSSTLFDTHYPYLFDNAFIVNVPPSFQFILRLIQPVLSESSSKPLKPLGDRKEWLQIVDEKIDRSQRSVKLGGTIVRDQ